MFGGKKENTMAEIESKSAKNYYKHHAKSKQYLCWRNLQIKKKVQKQTWDVKNSVDAIYVKQMEKIYIIY